MRRLAPLLGVLVLSLGALVWAWFARDGEAPVEVESAAVPLPQAPVPTIREPVLLPPARTPREELDAISSQARALLRRGLAAEAVSLLETWRERLPEAFEAAGMPALLDEMRVAAAPAAPDRAEAQGDGTATTRRFRASREVAALAKDVAARARLERHVDLFVPRSDVEGAEPQEGAAADPDWLDALYGAHVDGERTWTQPADLLGVADAEAAEARRMGQLRRLASRGATEFLEPVHGTLLWLALHQGDDGRISDRSVLARCKVLGHGVAKGEKSCFQVWRGGLERQDTASTALALLAFLDFRDQDAKEVFEPAIAQATRWLVAQQKDDGTFEGSREYYVTAISLMALAQAAASADSKPLREVVAKGLVGLYVRRGPDGGYRYRPRQAGDLSVSGWVAQAVEAAQAADVPVPEGMEDDLRRFLDGVWLLEWRFHYGLGALQLERSTLFPVGMLMGHILWPEPEERVLETWRTRLRVRAKKRPPLYTLYYGLRVSLVLEDGLTEPWRAWVTELAGEQVRKGTAAGLFPYEYGHWADHSIGCVVRAALTALTLEHALYER